MEFQRTHHSALSTQYSILMGLVTVPLQVRSQSIELSNAAQLLDERIKKDPPAGTVHRMPSAFVSGKRSWMRNVLESRLTADRPRSHSVLRLLEIERDAVTFRVPLTVFDRHGKRGGRTRPIYKCDSPPVWFSPPNHHFHLQPDANRTHQKLR